MTVSVVDIFEVVGVDHQQGERAPGALKQQAVLGQFFIKTSTVECTGQGIVRRQFQQLGIGLGKGGGALQDRGFE